MPVVAFGATEALELCGAAYLAGLADCRVLLPRGEPRSLVRYAEGWLWYARPNRPVSAPSWWCRPRCWRPSRTEPR